MGLSKLSEKCQNCPFVDKCKNKQMEALSYFSEPHISANTTIITGKPTEAYIDEIERQLYSHLHARAGLQL